MGSSARLNQKEKYLTSPELRSLLAVLPSSRRMGDKHRLFEYFLMVKQGEVQKIVADCQKILPPVKAKHETVVAYSNIEAHLTRALPSEEAAAIQTAKNAAAWIFYVEQFFGSSRARAGDEFKTGIEQAFQLASQEAHGGITEMEKAELLEFLEQYHPHGQKICSAYRANPALNRLPPTRDINPRKIEAYKQQAQKPKPAAAVKEKKGISLLMGNLPTFSKRGDTRSLFEAVLRKGVWRAGDKEIVLLHKGTPSRSLKLAAYWANLMETQKAKVSEVAPSFLGEAALKAGLGTVTATELQSSIKVLQMFWSQGLALGQAYGLQRLPGDPKAQQVTRPIRIKGPDFRRVLPAKPQTATAVTAAIPAAPKAPAKPIIEIKTFTPGPQIFVPSGKKPREEEEPVYPAGRLVSPGLGKKGQEIYFTLKPTEGELSASIEITLTAERDSGVFKGLLCNMKSNTPSEDKSFELLGDGTIIFIKHGNPNDIPLGRLNRPDLTVDALQKKQLETETTKKNQAKQRGEGMSYQFGQYTKGPRRGFSLSSYTNRPTIRSGLSI